MEMAGNAAFLYERSGLYYSACGLSIFKVKVIMVQEIIAFAILLLAVGFLIKKFFWKSKKKKDCGDGNCGCS